METVYYNYSINRKLHSILTAKLSRLCDIMGYIYQKATGNCLAMARERMQ